MRKIGASVSRRYIRPTCEATTKSYFVNLLETRALNLETKKKATKLKAGKEYLLYLGGINPKAVILHCRVNQDIVDAGACNWTHRIITPLDNDTDVKFIVRFKAAADLDLKKLEYGINIIMEEGMYSKWI